MSGTLWWFYVALAAAAVTQSLLLTLFAWEQRRFVRRRLAKPVPLEQAWPVLVCAPCKGLDWQLADNLRCLFEQDYPDWRLRLIVESDDDPATEVIDRLQAAYPSVRAERIVAGQATDGGQKVHNLLAATRSLDPRSQVLAFVDSDARPHPGWLWALVARLERNPEGAVTAYRWFVPAPAQWAGALLSAVNAVVAGLFGPGGRHLIWGGAWALRRDVFEAIGLRQAWQGTLSDDLVASRVLRASRRRVEFEPACMVLSPLETSWSASFEFLRRQFTIGKAYVPLWWAAAWIVASVLAAAWWSSLVLATLLASTGRPLALLPGSVAAVLYANQVLRARWRQDQGLRYLNQGGQTADLARSIDLWLGPLVATWAWLAMAASAWGWQITWRGIRYRLAPGGRVRSVDRLDAERPIDPHPGPAAPHFDRVRTARTPASPRNRS